MTDASYALRRSISLTCFELVFEFCISAAIAEIPGGSGGGGGGGGSDYEQDPLKVASVPPGHLEIGPPETSALQVACGLHHTGDISTCQWS